MAQSQVRFDHQKKGACYSTVCRLQARMGYMNNQSQALRPISVGKSGDSEIKYIIMLSPTTKANMVTHRMGIKLVKGWFRVRCLQIFIHRSKMARGHCRQRPWHCGGGKEEGNDGGKSCLQTRSTLINGLKYTIATCSLPGS